DEYDDSQWFWNPVVKRIIFCVSHFYNLAFIITIIPAAKSRLSSSDNSSNSILTGIRCCIFTKFPAELSVGTKEYLEPVAPDMADMCPENSLSGKASTLMLTFWPSYKLAIWVSL